MEATKNPFDGPLRSLAKSIQFLKCCGSSLIPQRTILNCEAASYHLVPGPSKN
jgi:hypothetical protein